MILRKGLTDVHDGVIGDQGGFAVKGHHSFREDTSHAVNHRHHRLDVRTCLEHKSDGKRIAAKIPVIDDLLDAVVEDVEILLGKIENEFAVPVSDRNPERSLRWRGCGSGSLRAVVRPPAVEARFHWEPDREQKKQEMQRGPLCTKRDRRVCRVHQSDSIVLASVA